MPHRRPAGSGSAHRLADGRWRARRRIGSRGSFEEVYGFGATQAGALKDLADKVKARRSIRRLGARSTVAQLLDWWVEVELAEQVADGRLAATSRAKYARTARLHIAPAKAPTLARFEIGDLSAADARGWQAEMRAAGASARTRRDALVILGVALAAAVRYEVIDRNVAHLVDKPKLERRRRDSSSVEHARRLLAAASGRDPAAAALDLEALYWLALHVPLRPGELLGVEWARLDLDAGTLEVARNLVWYTPPLPVGDRLAERRRAVGYWRLHDPKGHRSRTVPLPAAVVAVLRRHRARQAQRRLAAGGGWRPVEVVEAVAGVERRRVPDLVFADGSGLPVSRYALADDLEALCAKAEVPRMTPHALRHAARTLLADLGVDPLVAQQLGGWASADLSDNVYTGVLGRAMREAVDRLGERLA